MPRTTTPQLAVVRGLRLAISSTKHPVPCAIRALVSRLCRSVSHKNVKQQLLQHRAQRPLRCRPLAQLLHLLPKPLLLPRNQNRRTGETRGVPSKTNLPRLAQVLNRIFRKLNSNCVRRWNVRVVSARNNSRHRNGLVRKNVVPNSVVPNSVDLSNHINALSNRNVLNRPSNHSVLSSRSKNSVATNQNSHNNRRDVNSRNSLRALRSRNSRRSPRTAGHILVAPDPLRCSAALGRRS